MSKRRPAADKSRCETPATTERDRVCCDHSSWCCLAIDLSPHALVLWSPDGTVLDCNTGAGAVFGYERSELVGQTVTRLAADAAGGEFLLGPDTTPTGQAVRSSFSGVDKDGRDFPLEVERRWVALPSGPAVLGLLRDVTAQRRAEAEVARRRVMDETVATISSNFISRSDDELDDTIAQALARLAEVTGSEAVRVCVFSDSQRGVEAVHEWFAEGRLGSAQFLVGRMLDPRARPVALLLRAEAMPIEDVSALPEGSPERASLEELGTRSALVMPMVCAGRLVGSLSAEAAKAGHIWSEDEQRTLETAAQVLAGALQRRRAQQQLEAGHRRLRQLSELAPDMILEADAELNVTYMNRAAQEALGYTDEDIAGGLHISALTDEATAPDLHTFFEGAIADEGGRIRRLDLHPRAGGSMKVETHSVPVVDARGRAVGIITIARDITQRVRIEQAARLAALGELAAGVAHEFNNLLSVMSAQAEVAQAQPSDTVTKKLIQTVLDAAAQGGRITKSLEGFARPQEPRREPVTIREPLDAALAMAAHELRNGNVRLHREYGDEDRLILADSGQLQQVFLNLIINACHAMPQGGTLTVVTGHDKGEAGQPRVTARIADTGTGIAPDALPRIFEPFFTTKRKPNSRGRTGTGLGLAVSHSIITAHGGVISVDSEPGAGTVFTIALDEHESGQAKPRARRTAAPQIAGATGQGRRVLVAEDSALLSEAIRTLLDAAGFQVILAATTGEALKAMGETPPDIIVTDLMMPGGGGGREVLELAMEMESKPPVILMTGRTEEVLADELLAEGASRCLQKPFRLKDLLAEITDVLGDDK